MIKYYSEWRPGLVAVDVGRTKFVTVEDGLVGAFASVALCGYILAMMKEETKP